MFRAIAVLSLLLAACGGDGGSAPTPTPTPTSSFPTISQLVEITALRGFSLVNEDSNISFTRVEENGTATVSLDGVRTSVRFVSPVYDTQFLNSDRVTPDDSLGSSFPIEDVFQQDDGITIKRVTIVRPEIGDAKFDYLRAFTYQILDSTTGGPALEDVYRTTAGLESDTSVVNANGGVTYKFVVRGLGRRNSLPTFIDQEDDPKNVGTLNIAVNGNQVSFDIDVFGRLLNDNEVFIGKFRGEGSFSGDGSSFSGDIVAQNGRTDSAAGTFVGAFYGPNADEVAMSMQVDASTDIRLLFGLSVYGLRN